MFSASLYHKDFPVKRQDTLGLLFINYSVSGWSQCLCSMIIGNGFKPLSLAHLFHVTKYFVNEIPNLGTEVFIEN